MVNETWVLGGQHNLCFDGSGGLWHVYGGLLREETIN